MGQGLSGLMMVPAAFQSNFFQGVFPLGDLGTERPGWKIIPWKFSYSSCMSRHWGNLSRVSEGPCLPIYSRAGWHSVFYTYPHAWKYVQIAVHPPEDATDHMITSDCCCSLLG